MRSGTWPTPATCCASAAIAAGLLIGIGCWASDWPQYRGPTLDGISTDRLTTEWTGQVTNPVWRVYLGNGLSSVAVAGDRVFTQVKRTIQGAAREVALALGARTGQELWARVVDLASYPDGGVGGDDGPRTTPAVDSQGVYVLSSYLKLLRLDPATGSVVWSNDLRALYGGDVIAWQNAASPVLDNGLVFVNVNAAPRRIAAFRTADGSVAWRSAPEVIDESMTHSTPVVATLHGVRQLIVATQGGLVAFEPQTGTALWRFTYPFSCSTSLAPSPVVHQDIVFITAAQVYGMGSVAVRLSLSNGVWAAMQLWANVGYSSTLASHWMTPVARDGFLYGQFGVTSLYDGPNAQLKCVDLRTGSVLWSTNGFGRGNTLLVGEHLLVLTERGQLVLAKPDPGAYTEVARFQAVPDYSSVNKCWNAPAVADGRVYVRSTAYLACFDLSWPSLKLLAPQRVASNRFVLRAQCTDGSPVRSNRLGGLTLCATTNLALPVAQWTRLTNAAVLSNGTVYFQPVDAGQRSQQFFCISESE